MQHGHGALELGLHLGITGGWEAHLPELIVLLAPGAARQRRSDETDDDDQMFACHGGTPMEAARTRAPANAAGSQRKRTVAPSRSDMPADGISAAATKGLRQVLLAARGPVQRSAYAGYNVSRPVGSVHSRHYFGLEGSPDVASGARKRPTRHADQCPQLRVQQKTFAKRRETGKE